MAMTYATVTGRIVIPGTTTGIPGELHATPRTANGVLTFPADDYTTIGPAVAQVTADGTLSPSLKIPTAVPAGLVWRLVFHPKGKGNLPVLLGDYEITASTDIADLVTVVGSDLGGSTDHGTLSGALSVAGGGHEIDLGGNLTVTVTGVGDVTLVVHGTGQTLTVAGEAFVIDGDEVILVLTTPRGVQIPYLAGGGTGEPVEPDVPDSTAPSAVLGLTAVDGSGQVSASWTASTDTESSVSYHWRVWLTSGGASGTYTTTSATSFTKSGLAAGDYTVQVYASSAGGSTSVVSATATATAPLTVDFLDTFTRTAGSLSANPTPDIGASYSGPTSGATITAGGKLLPTDGGFVVSARSAQAREWTAKITKPTTAGEVMVFVSGQGVQFNGNGRVYTGEIGSITYNVTGGTNSWTADGYLTAGEHTVKVTRAIGGATMTVYVDGVKVLEGQGPAAPTNHNVMLYRSGGDGLIDDVEVKS